MRILLRTTVFAAALFLLATASAGADFTVNTTGDTADAAPGNGACADSGGMCSLRAAISEANALAGNDTITLPAGSYTQTLVAANEDLNAGGDLDITGNLVINGAGAATTIIQANASSGVATERVINVRAGATVTLDGVTIRHGRFTGVMTLSTRGGGIENLGTLTISNSIVRDNVVNSTSGNPIGGGIHNGGPSLTLTSSTVTANSCIRVTGGSAFGGGVDSIVAATITITDSSISGNTATSQAGGFGFGAGMYLESAFNVNATNSHFDNNMGSGTSGTNGIGVRALASAGAAVFNATNTTFSGNTAGSTGSNQGVGIQFFTVTAVGNTLTANLNGVTLNGNSGNGPGVGINATLSTGGPQNITIRNSTLSGNVGATNGGAMNISNVGNANGSAGTYNFVNSTISGNSARGNGGGIYVEQPTAGPITANFNFATISNNTANSDNTGTESGGGIFKAATGTVNLKNTIVANNAVGTGGAGPDLGGTFNSQDYNHVENTTGATFTGTTTNNVTGTDPQLGPLASNGGPTFTHLPGSGSPVVNTIPNGTNDCGTTITTDQRGQPRPISGACDKGSVEIGSVAVPAYIAGQVYAPSGEPLRFVTVTLSGGSLPSPRTVQTGTFGYYRFDNVLTGSTYTLSVAGPKMTFTPPSRMISLTGNLDNENFISDPR